MLLLGPLSSGVQATLLLPDVLLGKANGGKEGLSIAAQGTSYQRCPVGYPPKQENPAVCVCVCVLCRATLPGVTLRSFAQPGVLPPHFCLVGEKGMLVPTALASKTTQKSQIPVNSWGFNPVSTCHWS